MMIFTSMLNEYVEEKENRKDENRILCEDINTLTRHSHSIRLHAIVAILNRNYIITLLSIELQRFKLIFAKQNVNYRLSYCDIVILKL